MPTEKPKTDLPAPDNPHADVNALDQLQRELTPVDSAPPGAPAPPDANTIPTKQIVAMVLMPAFAIVAPNWNIKPDEIGMLAEAYAPLLDKYFPDLTKFGPELGAVMVTLAIFGPRINTPRHAPPPEKKPADAQAK